MNVTRTLPVATLGETLRRRRREELKLDTAEAAQRIGVSQPSYSDWENDKSKPGDQYLTAIADFLGTTRAEVVLLRSGEDPAQVAQHVAGLEQRIAALEEMIRRLGLPPAPPDPPGT